MAIFFISYSFVGNYLTSTRLGKNHALFFAINDYDSIRPLSNPIADAKAIAQELERTYNFTTEVVENPTIEEIEAKLKLYANRFANKELDQDGQLFIYFSGHGVVDNQNGFFLAKDSDPEKLSRTAFAYEYWRPFTNNISCKHILVAIDACFSGTFDPNWWSRSDGRFKRPGELSDSEKLIANHEQYTTRLFFTSAAETESPDQSNFARKLLEGLRSGGGTDNILTSTELFAYVELANPKPHRGEFGKNEAGSSFLFITSNPVEYVVDPDGNRYKTVKINGKIWLAKNLNYDLGKDCWCYKDSIEYCDKYGKLYTWEAAELSCRILGKDWRLPTDQEWRDLINFYGGYADGINITINGNTINKFPSTHLFREIISQNK
ncbi:MAG: FISUMP domain-containing protein [Saprospiraceae bacterium]